MPSNPSRPVPASVDTGDVLWSPDEGRIAAHPMDAFRRVAEARAGRELPDFRALHAWSVADRAAFWDLVWDHCGIVGEKGARVLENGDAMPGARHFPDASLSYAENMLSRRGERPALVFRGEDKVRLTWSWDDLHAAVSRIAQAYRAHGVRAGDRIAAIVPNRPETVACMLAANAIGAIWSSCSPDFGEKGIVDRFGQIEPVLTIACDGYWYNGKAVRLGAKLAAVEGRLTSRATVVMDYLGEAEAVAEALGDGCTLDAFLAPFQAGEVAFERLPFDHPLYILFSSGTTGVPKCIVHSQGGILLKHASEHRLQSGIGAKDRAFWFTTCGWMMWNWLVSALTTGATVMLYDGSPFAPDPDVLWDFAQDEGITFFGTSAKFIDAQRNAGQRPRDTHDLSRMRTIASTGSPLAPENFAYVYDAIGPDLHLASVSGGTDLCGCFVGAVHDEAVRVGEIQGPVLGMDMRVWDEEGRDLAAGEGKGELVCAAPFPSMPLGFWNDPDGSKYHDAYFARFDNAWCHGDFAEWTASGGMVIHGRSDATLNPGGVRIGTAEIYNCVETLPQVEEALCIGQIWQSDTRVVLFVRLADGVALDDRLQDTIRRTIRQGASPRHVPAVIVAVADIPRTKSGKITELAVREIVHGRPVKNREALANPEALAHFENRPELHG